MTDIIGIALVWVFPAVVVAAALYFSRHRSPE